MPSATGRGASPGPWWKTGVIYQIYPRSFADGDADGVGDLHGIRRRLDHLQWLGVAGLWLSPIFPSPMADNGYDVSDYCNVDPVFGDLSTFDLLLRDAHDRGLRCMLDWVPNHTSDQHPWFLDSRSSRASARRDWYIWKDGRGTGPPNNWRSVFGGPAWNFDRARGQWYLHSFLRQQPDLNWRNAEVRAAMHDTLRFWLERGVDGFRADVINMIGKDVELVDLASGQVERHLCDVYHDQSTLGHLRGIRRVLDQYGDRPMAGEVHLDVHRAARYYGEGDMLHMVFNFALTGAPWDAGAWAHILSEAEGALPPGGWPAWVLSSHDVSRHRSRFGGHEDRARVAALVLLTLRGTPFLYAGEELGMLDLTLPRASITDPHGRERSRAPIPWDATPTHGWGPGRPWLPFAPESERANRASLLSDQSSLLHLYRRLIAARGASPALQEGALELVEAPDGVLRYERTGAGDRRLVIANFAGGSRLVHVDGDWTIDVSTGTAAGPWSGRIEALQAVVLKPEVCPN